MAKPTIQLSNHICPSFRRRIDCPVHWDDPLGYLDGSKVLIGITGSRLGYDANLHQKIGRFLSRAVLDARARDAAIIIAAGSAIESWAIRAAELFDVPWLRIRVAGERAAPANTHVAEITLEPSHNPSVHRDSILVQLADRIEAVHVRRGGRIFEAIDKRLSGSDHDTASVRVALFGHPQCAAAELIRRGAIGWYSPSPRTTPLRTTQNANRDANVYWQTKHSSDRETWATQTGQWLVHCTRARRGSWPDETENQYRDQVLLGDQRETNRTPLDTLVRLLRSRRILASSVATAKSHPVVCFTDLALLKVLSMRCYRSHLGRWDYEPFGVAIEKNTAVQAGFQPVIYGHPSERKKLPEQDLYRFHPLGKTHDWRSEQEWRSPSTVNLDAFPLEAVKVFAPASDRAKELLSGCRFQVTWLVPKDPAAADDRV